MVFFRNTISPKNEGRAKEAQLELDWTIARANTQLMEAIKVDGVEIDYWKRTDEGNFCTCGFGINHPQNNIKTDTDPNNSTVVNDSIIVSPTQANVPESQDPSPVTIRNAWGDNWNDTQPSNKVLDSQLINDATQVNKEYKALPSATQPQPTGDDDDFFDAPDGYDLITGMERTQCGICLGTGKTNAWTLLGGKRDVFEYYSVNKVYKYTIRNDTRPVSFQTPCDPTAYVEWLYVLPTYFKSCLNYSVRNNTQAVRDLKILYKIAGSNDPFQRMTLDFLNSRNGTPTTLILRVQPIVTNMTGLLIFTHCEFIWQLAKFPLAQMEKVSVATNQQIRDTIITTTFTLPPSIENVTKNDVIYDNKYNQMWTFSGFSGDLTARRQVLGWSVEARNMQPYEQRSLLKIAHDRYYAVAYDGLERFSVDIRT